MPAVPPAGSDARWLEQRRVGHLAAQLRRRWRIAGPFVEVENENDRPSLK
jgi:hypothetical protein